MLALQASPTFRPTSKLSCSKSYHRKVLAPLSALQFGSTSSPSPNICVVGAGVIGLTSALRILQQFPRAKVTVIAEKFGVDTTTAGAAGVWQPYKVSDTPEELTNRWGAITFGHLVSLFESPVAATAGVNMIYGTSLFKEKEERDPSWAPITYSFRRLDHHDLGFYRHRFADGYMYQTAVCEGRLYIAWLTQRIKALGGKLVQQKLFSLADVLEQGTGRGSKEEWDIIINCSGLGAAELSEDGDVYPIRGQIIRVKAPWITHCVFAGDTYIIPNRDYVVLGGTGQYDDWNTNVSLEDRERILFNCCQVFPSLAGAEVLGDWVGLRPGRKTIRLDAALLERPGGGLCPVIHNYGHGGSGLTLGWGCAEDVVYMAQLLLT